MKIVINYCFVMHYDGNIILHKWLFNYQSRFILRALHTGDSEIS
jgi:hypothetical protein